MDKKIIWNRLIEQKGASKIPKSEEKKAWLGLRELCKLPRLFICGFDGNVAQLFSDSSLHQWLHGPIKACIDLLYNNAHVAR